MGLNEEDTFCHEKTWKKVLYVNQGVPDNYVGPSFLDELKKNLHIRTYAYWPVVVASGVVTQQLSSVCLFLALFAYMESGSIRPEYIIVASTAISLTGYAIYVICNGRNNRRTRLDDLKTALIFVAFTAGLSPVLTTLTDTISTDTIYAMSAAMMGLNLLFHDYGTQAAMVSQSLSLNAAIFASVCLASRLPSPTHGFATIAVATEIFALWPLLRTLLQEKGKECQVVLTTLCVAVSLVAMAAVNLSATMAMVLAQIFITFLCPAWLLRLQPYKNNIYGPWDEAVIRD